MLIGKKILFKAGCKYIGQYYIDMVAIMGLIVINSLAARIPVAGLILGVCEILYLIVTLFCRRIEDFTVVALVLLSANIENPGFAMGDRNAVLFSIYNLPVVKGYLLLVIMALGMLKCFRLDYCSTQRLLGKNGYRKFITLNMLLFLISIPMSLFTLAVNDNGMFIHADMWRYVVRDGYQMIHVIAIVCLTCRSLERNDGLIDRLKNLTLSILSAATWAAVILAACGNYYSIWGDDYYITCPLILFFSPGLILFFLEEHGIFNLATGIVALLFQLRYTVGIAGTWWLYVILVGMVFVKKIITINNNQRNVLFKVVCLAGIVVATVYVVESRRFNMVSGQITYKLASVLRLFQGGGNLAANYSNAGGSIQVRVEGIVCAFIEIILKPIFFPFGKGYGGTVLHHWGGSDWDVSGSTFADTMIKYQTYSAFHTPIAEIIVNFGLMGIFLIFILAKEFLGEFLRREGNSFIILGFLWFVFFYSLYYSFNLGVAWLCCGLYIKYASKPKTGGEV